MYCKLLLTYPALAFVPTEKCLLVLENRSLQRFSTPNLYKRVQKPATVSCFIKGNQSNRLPPHGVDPGPSENKFLRALYIHPINVFFQIHRILSPSGTTCTYFLSIIMLPLSDGINYQMSYGGTRNLNKLSAVLLPSFLEMN